MFSAPTRSAWSVYPQRTHWNFSCVGRFSSATCPQSLRGQVREVLRGSTGISLRPALSALCARMPRTPPQHASWMLLFSPAFAAAPFGRNAPALPGSGLGFGARTMFAMLNRSLDADRLDPACDGPVLVHPNVPHALQADAGDRVVWGAVPAAAIPLLGELSAA